MECYLFEHEHSSEQSDLISPISASQTNDFEEQRRRHFNQKTPPRYKTLFPKSILAFIEHKSQSKIQLKCDLNCYTIAAG